MSRNATAALEALALKAREEDGRLSSKVMAAITFLDRLERHDTEFAATVIMAVNSQRDQRAAELSALRSELQAIGKALSTNPEMLDHADTGTSQTVVPFNNGEKATG